MKLEVATASFRKSREGLEVVSEIKFDQILSLELERFEVKNLTVRSLTDVSAVRIHMAALF